METKLNRFNPVFTVPSLMGLLNRFANKDKKITFAYDNYSRVTFPDGAIAHSHTFNVIISQTYVYDLTYYIVERLDQGHDFHATARIDLCLPEDQNDAHEGYETSAFRMWSKSTPDGEFEHSNWELKMLELAEEIFESIDVYLFDVYLSPKASK